MKRKKPVIVIVIIVILIIISFASFYLSTLLLIKIVKNHYNNLISLIFNICIGYSIGFTGIISIIGILLRKLWSRITSAIIMILFSLDILYFGILDIINKIKTINLKFNHDLFTNIEIFVKETNIINQLFFFNFIIIAFIISLMLIFLLSKKSKQYYDKH